MSTYVSALSTEDLARVGLVYGLPVRSADSEDPAEFRENLIFLVSHVRVVLDEISPYPPCFGEKYTPDEWCLENCEEAGPCKPCNPGYRDPKIEAQLVELRGLGSPVPAVVDPVVEVVPEPAPAPAPPPRVAVPPRKKRKKLKVAVPTVRKRTRRKPMVDEGKTYPHGTLTEKRGVFIGGRDDYVRTEMGERKYAYRPTGSAAMAKALRPGHRMSRTWKGSIYECVKHANNDWELEAIVPLDDDKNRLEDQRELRGEHYKSIGRLTRAITGSNTWGGAKFFGLVPGVDGL